MDLCKASHGLADSKQSEPLAEKHLAIAGSATGRVSLISVTHHQGVNALAAEQTVQFSANLTVVYGENAAGKSGYTRILKQACRSRYTGKVIGNVLASVPPVTPHATIRLNSDGCDSAFDWTPKAEPSEALAAVSIFDSHCVPVYLKDKTDVAFRPFGLDVFDKLSAASADVKAALEKERSLLAGSAAVLPTLPEGTEARRIVDGLSSLTAIDSVRRCATLTTDDQARLLELRKLRRDYEADDPKKLARELTLRAQRIEGLTGHLEKIEAAFTAAALTTLAEAQTAVEAAEKAVARLKNTMISADLLAGTGTETWKRLWESARTFAALAYPDHGFPHTEPGARCVLCQQQLGEDAVARLQRFAEYAASHAQFELASAETTLKNAAQQFTGIDVEPNDMALALQELALEDAGFAETAAAFLERAKRLQQDVNLCKSSGAGLPSEGVGSGATQPITAVILSLRSRATELMSSAGGMKPEARQELSELEARCTLKDHLQTVLQEIERRKRIAAYGQCLDDTSTSAITKKSTELTKRLVTDTLRQTLNAELNAIEFTHLDVEVQTAGGSKGALFHRLVFSHAPSVNVTDVLSEGEARALSLAAFLTELSTAPQKSSIVFDDPVSSLDHIWRERVARRLVAESADRQVIVFTHDLLFLRFLIAEADRKAIPLTHQYIRRQGAAGVCSQDLPWIAMLIKDRVGVLRNRAQAADKVFRTEPDRYESEAREIYGLLREAWEQGVGEVLLNSVVERYRPTIETNRIKKLYDITEEDCETVQREMTECSRWIRGHDAPPADGTPVPEPTEIRKRIDSLDEWVGQIRKRR